MTPAQRLHVAVVDLAAQGLRPRCGDPSDLWLSDVRAEREQAALLCRGCPVLVACGDAAEAAGEAFGVWGGVDQTRVSKGAP